MVAWSLLQGRTMDSRSWHDEKNNSDKRDTRLKRLSGYSNIIFFSVRERAVFYKSCNLIGSVSGQYSPHAARSRLNRFRNHFLGLGKKKCYSPAKVGPYREKLCPLSYVPPLAVSKTSGTVFTIRTSRLVNNIYVLLCFCSRVVVFTSSLIRFFSFVFILIH